jgi:hypothetical protein
VTWFKVDDSFHSHPKVLATTPAALGLWVVAGAWCGANLTDGFVPDHALPRLLPGSGELAKELVSVGLWRRAKGGYRFHDWCDFNPDSTSVIKERDAARDRMRRLRADRKGGANGRTNTEHVRKKSRTEPRSEHPVDNSDSRMIENEPAGQNWNGSGEQHANVRENFAARSQPRPDPTRPVNTNGSVGGHLQVADARENEGREQLCRTYHLTDDKAEQAMTTIAKNSRDPVKDWPSLLDHMAGNGTLATVIDPLQRPTPPPAAEPARHTATGCDTHPDGAIDPVPPDGWGQCLICNTQRRRAQPNRRTA